MKIHRILHGLPVIILLSLAVAVVAPSQSLAANVTPLVSFNGTTGVVPEAGLIADAKGNLFGTTTAGGANNGGTVFEIAKTATGYATTPTVLVNFDSTSGVSPQAGLIADANGNLFGTTTRSSSGMLEGPIRWVRLPQFRIRSRVVCVAAPPERALAV